MQANKLFYVIGGIVFLVVGLMAWFLFSSGESAPAAKTANPQTILDTSLKNSSEPQNPITKKWMK